MLKLGMLFILSGWAEISSHEDTAFPEIWNIYVKYLGKIWTEMWLLPAKMVASFLLNRFNSLLDETPAPSPRFLPGQPRWMDLTTEGIWPTEFLFFLCSWMKSVCLLKNSDWKKYWWLPGHLQKRIRKLLYYNREDKGALLTLSCRLYILIVTTKVLYFFRETHKALNCIVLIAANWMN